MRKKREIETERTRRDIRIEVRGGGEINVTYFLRSNLFVGFPNFGLLESFFFFLHVKGILIKFGDEEEKGQVKSQKEGNDLLTDLLLTSSTQQLECN